GYPVNHKRVARLMRTMGLEAIYPKPRLSRPGEVPKRYPYLLKAMTIERPNQVWSTDITYIRMEHGFVYLVAIIDWYSRYVLSWELSNTLDSFFCIAALERALRSAKPGIFNSDQGSQFTWVAQSNKKERPAKISPTDSNRKKFVSVGMDEGDAGITSSWSDSGEASSMRKSISSTTKACPRPPKD
ncbi:MAG TPA: hypothetical protein ENI81_11355, partial [Phycisphaerales bacterium]|nr:hypothetical protein [Phycisphaerales bacterium]